MSEATKRKATINKDAFTGEQMSAFNGQGVTLSGKKGVSGETHEATLAGGGCLFLTPDQYTTDPA